MRRIFIALVLAAVAGVMVAGLAGLPRPGDPAAPVHQNVAAHIVAHGLEDTGSRNLVTAVLLAYRGYDTFGEVVVIFAALAAVMVVLAPAVSSTQETVATAGPEVTPSPVVGFVIRVLAPFIAAFAVLVLWHGEASPGGGFQAGVILGALLVLLSVVMGRGQERPLLPVAVMRWLQAAGPLAFAVAMLIGVAGAGVLLGLPAHPDWARHAVLLLLELGIGLGGAAIILGLYLQMRGR
jgi:multicomponent Na+:H+ antiporter subunit B